MIAEWNGAENLITKLLFAEECSKTIKRLADVTIWMELFINSILALINQFSETNWSSVLSIFSPL